MINRRFGVSIPDPAALADALRVTARDARQALLNALVRPAGSRPIVNPQAGVAGFQSASGSGVRVLPDDTSQATAIDLALVGGLALLRDVPFSEFNTHPDAIRLAGTIQAMGGLGTLGVLAGPGPDGLARLNASQLGTDRVGRLVLAPVPLGWADTSFNARRRVGNYVGNQAAYDALQAGRFPGSVPELPPQQPHGPAVAMSTGRDVASLVQDDFPVQIPELVACQLLANGAPRSTRFPLLPNETGFIGYGGPFDVICAINACRPWAEQAWFAKFTQERARPHELWQDGRAGLLHPAFLQRAGWIVERLPFLTSVYAGMCPIHSDNPSGHAFFSGFGFTILKAYFANGTVSRLGITQLHAELDVMAWHMAVGRSWAGIHSIRSLINGLRFGQQAAIWHLSELAAASPMKLGGTTFIGFDGKPVTVSGN